MSISNIERCLRSCRELARFCTRDGSIDLDSLRYTVIMENSREIVVDIEFDEHSMESGGKLAERTRCFGQLHLFLDQYGRVIRTETL